jgi:hypothetical protein
MSEMTKPAVHWFEWVQLAVLAVSAPLFLFPKQRFWWIFLLVPLLWCARYIAVKKFLDKTPLDLPLFILLIAILASTLRVTDFSYNLPKIAGLFYGIVLFYAIVSVLKTEKLLKWGTGLFLAGGFVFSLIGLLGMPTFKVKHLDFLMKIKDMIPHIDFKLPGAELGFSTNAIGGTLLLVIPLFFLLLWMTWRRGTRKDAPSGPLSSLLLTGGTLVTGAVLLLTQSRGAWVGLFIATVFVGLLQLRLFIKNKKIVRIVVIVILIVIIAAGVSFYSMIQTNKMSPGLRQVEGTLQFRVHIWNLTVPVIRDNPLWGAGLNNFRLGREIRYFWSSAHNQFMHVAVELGIPALIAYLALLIIIGYMCIEVCKTSKIKWLRTAVLGLGWGQLAFLFFGLTDAIPPGAKVGLLFWLSTALICAIYLTTENTKGTKDF